MSDEQKDLVVHRQKLGWLERWGSAFTAIIKGYAKVETKPETVNHGSSWDRPSGARPSFDPLDSLAVYAIHGYTHAAVSRAAQDLAALPIQLIRGTGKDAVIVEESPVLDLLDHPNSQSDSFLFREQLIVDLMLAGNFYILLLGPTDTPLSIVRLHPAEVRIITNTDGSLSYEHNSDGSIVVYTQDRVLHGRTAGWAKGPDSLYGTGGIQPLAKEIQADINAQKLVSEGSAKGRPDLIMSPRSEDDIWGRERRREILANYNSMTRAGGCLVLSGGVDLKEVRLSPREMEYESARTMAMQTVSSVFGVPGSVLGLPSANYATSRQQTLNYWTVQQKRGRRIDSIFTTIAKRFDPAFSIRTDYSSVEALQSVRDSKLARVEKHIANGVSPIDAYSYEGMGDIQLGPAPRPETEKEKEEKSIRLISDLLEKKNSDMNLELPDLEAMERYNHVTIKKVSPKKRKRWKDWAKRLHDPIEKKMARMLYRWLGELSRRYISRLKKQSKGSHDGIITKAIIWDTLLDKVEEIKILEKKIGPIWMEGWKLSGDKIFEEIFGLARKDIPDGLIWGQEKPAEVHIRKASREIVRTNSKMLEKIIQKGLNDNLPIRDVVKLIDEAAGFEFPRAMMIARTETTRALNMGANQAFQSAAAEGINLKKQWLSADDGNVRESHVELEKTPIGVNEVFRIGDLEAESPGGFGIASEDINCRCTIIPIVLD